MCVCVCSVLCVECVCVECVPVVSKAAQLRLPLPLTSSPLLPLISFLAFLLLLEYRCVCSVCGVCVECVPVVSEAAQLRLQSG